MIKPVLTFFSDLGLVVVLLIIMSAGLWGARLPYRQPAINSSAYQLEAFPVGLAWYQYGRVSPFYSLSPLNDYVVASGSGRIALLSKQRFDQKQFESSLDQPKHYQLWETMKTYGGFTSPSYWITTKELSVSYVSSIEPSGVAVVIRVVKFSSPRWIETQAMTLSYNASDVVTQDEGMITISNPTVAGSLMVIASLNQTITVDKKTQLIEVSAPVRQMTDKLTFAVKVKGVTEGEQ